MTTKRKIVLVLCVCIGIFLVALSGSALYYYGHPSKLKPLVETFLSRVTGTECSIKEISFSRKPFTIRGKGIQFIEHIQGFCLDIPEVVTQISLKGSFGRKTLELENLRLKGFSLSLQQGWHLPDIGRKAEKLSLLRRILGTAFSLFVAQDVKIMNAELMDGHVSGQWSDLRLNLNGLRVKLTPEQFLEIGCDARIQRVSDQLDLKIPRLNVVTDRPVYPPVAEIQGAVKAEEISFEAPWAKIVKAMAQGKIIYRRSDGTLRFGPVRISFDGLSLYENREARFVPLPSVLDVDADLDLGEATLRARSVHLLLGVMAELKAELQADLGGDHKFAAKVVALQVTPQKVFPLLPEKIKGRPDSLGFTGSVSLAGVVSGRMDRSMAQWECDLQCRLHENKLSFSGPAGRVQGIITGDIRTKGPLSELETTVSLSGKELALQAAGAELEQAGLNLSLAGKYPSFDVKALSVLIPRARWTREGREFDFTEIDAQARAGSVDMETGSLSLPELALRTSVLKNLLLSAEVKQGQLSLTARGKDVHVVELAQAIRLLPESWKLRATDSLQAQLVLTEGGALSLAAKLQVEGLGFQGQRGDLTGENLSLVLETTLRGKLGQQPMTGSIFCFAKEGEVLFDRFYFDLSKHNLVCNGNGTYNPSAGSLEVSDLRFQMENLASATINGTLFPEAFDKSRLLLHVPKVSLSPIFRQFVIEPYKNEKPFLDDLDVAGLFSADLAMEGDGPEWRVKGHSIWQDGEVSFKGKEISFKGIDLDLPLWYESGAGEKASSLAGSLELAGGLSVESFHLLSLPAQAMETSFKAAPHRLSTLSPLGFKVPGGQLDFGKIVCTDPFSRSPHIETSLNIKKIDLEPWLSGIWPSPVQGSARGKLDPVQIEGDNLRAVGDITANLFDGRVILSNLGVERFFSLALVIHLDAAWENVSLGELTRDTAFGKIEGVLRGQVKDLEIADGQPQKFDLFMETVQRDDVPQKISVRALDNIAQIGGGASPFSGLTGALISLFKELPYEKMGIKASLENDVFRINGTVKEDGKEYLVKKGGFSGVDVIIGGHGSNTISFKDMLNRIKRVTESKGGPVVQ